MKLSDHFHSIRGMKSTADNVNKVPHLHVENDEQLQSTLTLLNILAIGNQQIENQQVMTVADAITTIRTSQSLA